MHNDASMNEGEYRTKRARKIIAASSIMRDQNNIFIRVCVFLIVVEVGVGVEVRVGDYLISM